ncbi:hypothetical protein C8Q79DRAFT_920473 [Trametes meyenii]|nr:hypothetical protein C8Q79DRAFT_920473 [Trametes meyenii]
MARTTQRPKLTTEQRTHAKQKTAQMWEDINIERQKYNAAILELAEKHKKTRQWIAMQLFRGGKLLADRRKTSLYNAVVHDLAKKQSEAGNTGGRGTLSELAKEAAAIDCKSLPKEEQDRLLQQLEDDRTPSTGRISASESGNHVEGVMRRTQPELDGLAARTGCQYLLIITKREVTDNWSARVCSTPKMAEACSEVFKCIPETMAMRMEASITSGRAGVIRAMGGKRSTTLKAEIRAKVTEGLEDILTRGGTPATNLPRMEWVRYDSLVVEYGVELEGWPEGLPEKLCNPSDIKTTAELTILHAALFSEPPKCRWVRLSTEEWSLRKEKHRTEILEGKIKKRKSPVDGKGSRKTHKKPTSPETIEDSDDNDNCNDARELSDDP